MPQPQPIIIATRGSALALAQARMALDQCRHAFPDLQFDIKIIKTTGDKKLSASLAQPDPSLPKGLFTKELEVALLQHRADLAVHSLKDLPTDLPDGLTLGAVSARADFRDVLVYRDAGTFTAGAAAEPSKGCTPGKNSQRSFPSDLSLTELPPDAVVATSSTRRQAQLLAQHPGLKVVEIRGNVITRLQKLASDPGIDATILAAAGLQRLNFKITPEGLLTGEAVPDGLRATLLPPEVMLPCVGQAALGFEVRANDELTNTLCQRLNHTITFQCVTAERTFLNAMGGGCQSPVAALAQADNGTLHLRALSFQNGPGRYADGRRNIHEATELGQEIAEQLR